MKDVLLDTLFTYESWATRQLLNACLTLTPEQLDRPVGLGHGTVNSTLTHLVGTLFFFTDRLHRRAPRPRPDRDGRSRSVAELAALFDVADSELREAVTQTLTAHALTDLLNWTNTDEGPIDPLDQITYAVAFAQMLDHSNHHRTQIVDMLRLLGVDASLEWHPFEWDEAQRARHA